MNLKIFAHQGTSLYIIRFEAAQLLRSFKDAFSNYVLTIIDTIIMS